MTELAWPRRRAGSALVAAALVAGALLLSDGPLPLLALLLLAIAVLAFPWLVEHPFPAFWALLVAWPLLAPFARVELPPGIPDITFERVMILILIGALVVRQSTPGSQPLRPANLWIVLLALAQILSMIYFSFLEYSSVVLLPLAVYWVAKNLMTSERRLTLVLWALVVGALLVSATGFYERALDLTYSPFVAETGLASGTRWLDVAGGRAAGVLGNPAVFGAFMGVGLLASLALYRKTMPAWARLALGVSSLVLAYAVLVSYTRSAWLAAFAGLLVATLMSRHLRRLTVFAIWLLVLAISVGVLLQAEGLVPDEANIIETADLNRRIQETGTIEGRLDRAAFSIRKYLDSPFIGQGQNALDDLIADEYRTEGIGFNTSHNTFLTVAVNGGLLVLAPLLGLIAHWARLGVLTHRRRQGLTRSMSNAMALALGTITIYVVSGLFLELGLFGFMTSLFYLAGAVVEEIHARSKITAVEVPQDAG